MNDKLCCICGKPLRGNQTKYCNKKCAIEGARRVRVKTNKKKALKNSEVTRRNLRKAAIIEQADILPRLVYTPGSRGVFDIQFNPLGGW